MVLKADHFTENVQLLKQKNVILKIMHIWAICTGRNLHIWKALMVLNGPYGQAYMYSIYVDTHTHVSPISHIG